MKPYNNTDIQKAHLNYHLSYFRVLTVKPTTNWFTIEPLKSSSSKQNAFYSSAE